MIRLLTGDCREVLKTLPDASVQCCVTSPPYFGLRDYQTAQWSGGNVAECDHARTVWEGPKQTAGVSQSGHAAKRDKLGRRECIKCGAVRTDSQIGLEASPDAFVAEMVVVFREVRRVLRDDGTLWLNLGDSYAASNGSDAERSRSGLQGSKETQAKARSAGVPTDLKAKDLMMIPARVALALQADGWYLRSDIIWAKKNCMPESVTDRPSSAHEHVFLLTKQPRYFYDAEAIREEGVIPAGTRAAKGSSVRSELKDVNGRPPEYWNYTGTRNARNVWSIATQPFADAHFATFPPDLAERCIKAGTSERGCCATCGAPWVREIEQARTFESGSGKSGRKRTGKGAGGAQTDSGSYDVRMGVVVSTTTTGWSPSCSCDGPVVPCTILDPFSGAGTTALVADRLGRNAIGIELSEDYQAIARRRIGKDAGLFAQIGD